MAKPRSSARRPAEPAPFARGTLSRRQFVRLLTAASAAAVTAAAGAPAAAAEKAAPKGKAPSRPAAAKPPLPRFSAAEQKEIARQAKLVEDALEKIRAYALPAGSEPAVRFAVLRPARGGRRP